MSADRKTARKKLEQGARNILINGQWRQKRMDTLNRSLGDMDEAKKQLDEAAAELGENPHKRGSKEWNLWNHEHYIKPMQEQLEKLRKRK